CDARLTETWVLRVTPALADEIMDDPDEALEWLGSAAVVSVDNTHIADEGDRTIESVESEPSGTDVADLLDAAGDARSMTDTAALDAIAHMLSDPDWGAGMLEDIAELVNRTGRSTEGDEPTWDRH
ncbi:MAG: hypothetical protein M3011_00265, partial [Actinomycetota bacterium]|nr:hypothetical protein [Actinomycetota bacterium]